MPITTAKSERAEYQRKYQKKRYHKRMEEAKSILGGKCAVCGTTKNLELDHKDPKNKDFAVTKLWGVPQAEFEKEVKKCQLLCHKHHAKRTGKQRENGEVKSIPGKISYKSNGRKKKSAAALSAELMVIASEVKPKEAARKAKIILEKVGSYADGVETKLASHFNKAEYIDKAVVTLNMFRKHGKIQIIYTVYGRQGEAELVGALCTAIENYGKDEGLDLEYSDDLSEPGLIVKAVSLLL